MANIETICNEALHIIGYAKPIGNIYDGSRAAQICLGMWRQTRDALLIKVQPDWALRDTPLTVNKSAPNINNYYADYSSGWDPTVHPALPWLYEYAWPDDCLTPVQIKTTPIFTPQWRPQHKVFQQIFDGVTQKHVILCNEAGAILVYVAQIFDPNNWNDDFTEIMIETLAMKLKGELGREMPQQERQQDARNAPG